jgi:hypothetical protein
MLFEATTVRAVAGAPLKLTTVAPSVASKPFPMMVISTRCAAAGLLVGHWHGLPLPGTAG